MSFFKIFLLVITISSSLFSAVNVIKKIEVHKDELQLTFENPYDTKKIKRFKLSKPNRLVFDFKNTRIAKSMQNKRFKSLRIGQYKRNTVRIVIDSSPYICDAYRPLFALQSYHIPLPGRSSRTDIRSRSHLVAKKQKQQKVIKKQHKPLKKTYKKPKVKEQPKASLVPEIAEKYATYSEHRNQVIVIDAGHGGHDTGAIGGRKREKDLVLQIAKKLKKQLKKRGFPVYMTRDSDRFLRLSQRTKIADKKKAAVFISIHANAVVKSKINKIHGVETFFLQNTRDAKSQRIATRENRDVLKGAGSRLSKSVIIDSVLSGPKVVESNKLAISVHGRMIKNLRSRYKGVRDGGVRHAPFYVLVGASRPSILIEVGYISHYKERKRLFMPRYQDLLVKGIAEGVDSYLYHRKKEIDF